MLTRTDAYKGGESESERRSIDGRAISEPPAAAASAVAISESRSSTLGPGKCAMKGEKAQKRRRRMRLLAKLPLAAAAV